jgi:hypothetical protein
MGGRIVVVPPIAVGQYGEAVDMVEQHGILSASLCRIAGRGAPINNF